MRLTEAIVKNALEDHRLSTAEWTVVATALVLTADGQASTLEDSLVRALYNDTMSDATREGLSAYLRTQGYKTNAVVLPEANRPGAIKRALESNITREDAAFADLMRRTGRDKAPNITIAVIDGGFEQEHAALKGKQFPGHDYSDGDDDVHGDAHGSHTAGVATAGSDKILFRPQKLYAKDGYTPAQLEAAIDDAAKGGARVISMSFKIDSKDEVDAAKRAMARHPDVLFIKSAGNNGKPIGSGEFAPDVFLPANYLDNMIVVGNAKKDGAPYRTSNTGEWVSIAALGYNVYSSVSGGKYDEMTGTSMATPAVANVAAKVLLLDPGLTPDRVKQLIIDTGTYNERWVGKSNSGQVLNEGAAIRLAAYMGLRRRGVSDRAAALRVGLSNAERANMKSLERAYLP